MVTKSTSDMAALLDAVMTRMKFHLSGFAKEKLEGGFTVEGGGEGEEGMMKVLNEMDFARGEMEAINVVIYGTKVYDPCVYIGKDSSGSGTGSSSSSSSGSGEE